MAHFCLLVVTNNADDVADALRPFWNDDKEGRQQPHFVFIEDEYSEVDTTTGRPGYWLNPIGKWDGWTFGGRWDGLLNGANTCLARDAVALLEKRADIFSPVYAVLADGAWREPKDHRERDAADWPAQVRTIIRSLQPDAWVSIVDCHC